jgi:hypothetical protein
MIVANSLRKCLQATDSKQENSRGKSPQTAMIGSGERAGIRTLDPVIKSHVLYQLSYALAKGISYLIRQPFASLARLFV